MICISAYFFSAWFTIKLGYFKVDTIVSIYYKHSSLSMRIRKQVKKYLVGLTSGFEEKCNQFLWPLLLSREEIILRYCLRPFKANLIHPKKKKKRLWCIFFESSPFFTDSPDFFTFSLWPESSFNEAKTHGFTWKLSCTLAYSLLICVPTSKIEF